MENKRLFFTLVGLSAVITFLILVSLPTITESSSIGGIPPTDAFSKVYVNGQLIEADQYNDELYITTTGSLTTTISGDSVTIKLTAISCPALQALRSVDASGTLVCSVI